MFDVHCHLIDSKYGVLTPETIIEGAQKEGVNLICNGCGIKESEQAIKLAEKYKNVYVCVGLAYDDKKINLDETKKKLIGMCQNTKVVGIGEAGLDFYDGMSENLKIWQEALFRMHLEVAQETSLPVEIHNRNAGEDILNLTSGYKVTGLMHCFSGNTKFMKRCIDSGLYISIGGLITFKGRGELREVVRSIPEDKLLLETDAPYLAPEPVRGTINVPINVKIIAKAVAKLWNKNEEEVIQITDNNTRKLFKKLI